MFYITRTTAVNHSVQFVHSVIFSLHIGCCCCFVSKFPLRDWWMKFLPLSVFRFTLLISLNFHSAAHLLLYFFFYVYTIWTWLKFSAALNVMTGWRAENTHQQKCTRETRKHQFRALCITSSPLLHSRSLFVLSSCKRTHTDSALSKGFLWYSPPLLPVNANYWQNS